MKNYWDDVGKLEEQVFNAGGYFHYITEYQGSTRVFIWFEDGSCYMGQAKYKKGDEWNKSLGDLIALGRAVKKWKNATKSTGSWDEVDDDYWYRLGA